jgi:hypothetical protein
MKKEINIHCLVSVEYLIWWKGGVKEKMFSYELIDDWLWTLFFLLGKEH